MGNENGELKLVISLKGGKASVGVQAPECDPVFFGVDGGLGDVLGSVPGFVDEAKRRWGTSKLNPECKTQLPSQAEAAAAAKRTAATSKARGTTKQSGQTPMF